MERHLQRMAQALVSGSSMLDVLGLALHGCLGPGLVLLLVAWATLCCCRSSSGKRRQVCAGSRGRGRRKKTDDSDAEAPHGCRSSLLWVGSRPMGMLLCYDRDCGRCSQAVRERQQRLLARQARPSCCPYSSSSRDSGDSCRHGATASSFRPAKRTSVRSWWQPVLRKRKQRRPFPQRTALNTQGAATLPCNAGPLRQAEELVKMAPVHHEASLPPATGSDAAPKDGILPAGADPRPVTRLEQGPGFWKLLRMHTLRKSIETKLGALPTMVLQSHRRYTYRMEHRTAPTLLRSRPAPCYFCSPEALFLPVDVREFLEMHIREKKLCRYWGLPAGSLAEPRALPSAP
ncbi:uncharacterized protein LOC118163673 [Oxyura jamaicensis]|uniref:uncharacterized protein LOC118163673 n=1 Tax=Oxyura jamaicensis TaxID=8884 RepID=UPI0015A51048|nr:uncharacterized protein LOC118163673 [Oxyura jamaicensis]